MNSTPGRIRVLVVDDSVVIRRLVTEALAADPEIEVVGIAQNGQIALDKVAELKPDAVTMDIEMPDHERHRRRARPAPQQPPAAGRDVLHAHRAGRVGHPGRARRRRQRLRHQAVERRQLRREPGEHPRAADPEAQGAGRGPPGGRPRTGRRRRPRTGPQQRTGPFSVLAIGSSTGGPDALAAVLPALPADLPVPVLVVQHMPPVFTRLLAERLDALRTVARRARRSTASPLVPGTVLIAPGDHHLGFERTSGGRRPCASTEGPPENFCRPSVDVMFRRRRRPPSPGACSPSSSPGWATTAATASRGDPRGRRRRWSPRTRRRAWSGECPARSVTAGLADKVLPLDAIARPHHAEPSAPEPYRWRR